MKPYGMKREDHGCCPGHDRFPRETYNSRRSKRAHSRDNKLMHRIGRHRLKQELKSEIN
jgi:hypothetical protein